MRATLRMLSRLPLIERGRRFGETFSGRHSVAPDGAPPDNPLLRFVDSGTRERGIWKWDHYFDIYHRHFARFVGRDVRMLEIGVLAGGSLEMWHSYFGPGAYLYGVDVDERCRKFADERTEILIGDQGNRAFWQEFKRAAPRLDIVVDDGSHRAEDQIATLEELLPHLSPGGVFLCEDVQSENNRFTEFVHGLVKSMNVKRDGPANGVQQWIRSVTFYPYVIAIEKVDRPVDRLRDPKRDLKGYRD
jgi:hypothetical protein